MQIRVRDKRVVYGVHVSDRIVEDSNGQLIIYDAILARTGSYDYREDEILDDGDHNKIIKVYRTPEEVFDPVSMASFEHKPFCDEHPEEDVTTSNWKDLQKGYMFNIRRGKGDESDCLIGDIVVMDPETIAEIKNKEKRELSLGYNAEIVVDDDGKYYMTNIRGNHLALVDDGRAGIATIRDTNTIKNKTGGVAMANIAKSKRNEFFKKLYDEDIEEIEEVEEKEEPVEDEDLEPKIVSVEPVKDEDASAELLQAILDRLDKLVELCSNNVHDNDIVSVEEVSEDVPAEEVKVAKENNITENADEDVDTDIEKDPMEEQLVEEEVDTDDAEPKVFEMEKEEDLEDECDLDEVIKTSNKDKSSKLYGQFVNVGDSANKQSISEQVDESFRQRYIKFGGKR